MIYPNSRLRVGFAFNWGDLGYDPSTNEADLVNIIRANQLNFLNDGVTFGDVRVTVNPLPSFYANGYITIEATTRTPLPEANVFGDMAAYGFSQYLPIVQVTRRDRTLVDYAAPAPTSSPQVRPRPGEPTPDESVYFTVGTEYLPGTTEQERPYVPPLLPSEEQKKGLNTTWLLLGFGLLAVVLASRD